MCDKRHKMIILLQYPCSGEEAKRGKEEDGGVFEQQTAN